MKSILIVSVAAIALCGCDKPTATTSSTTTLAAASPSAAAAAEEATKAAADIAAIRGGQTGVGGSASTGRPTRFTKAEFDNYAYSKTKAQIRAEFGAPLVVHDDSDSWFYSSIPIFDAEAGTPANVTIRFAGLAGPEDFVASVSYSGPT